MNAVNGSFNSTIENVTATVNTSGLSEGQHIVFVRGKDAAGNWGAFSAVFLDTLPTSVELLSFTATAAEKAITLSWESASEVDNLGFNLLRATTADGLRTRLNADLIPSLVPPGSLFGAVYSYDDAPVMAGVRYFYWLEMVDIYGRTDLYGPVSARIEWSERIFLPTILAARP